MAVPSYDYQPPYAMPQLPKMGDPSSFGVSPIERPAPGGSVGGDGSYSPPYIGGPGDPNAGRMGGGFAAPWGPTSNKDAWMANGGTNFPNGQTPQSPAGGSNYGPYLGWDQQKLNDPTHNSPKYQFLRAMLDAGISSQNRDLGGAVAALKARGYPVEAVPGSSDQIKWGDQGTYDIFNGTNGDFFFGEQGGQQGGQPAAMPQPYGGLTGVTGSTTQPDLGLGPWNSSSYANPNSQQIANQSPGNMNIFGRQPYTPPYLNGAV